MKKILFISPSLNGGGAERRVTNLSILLHQRGYDVTVLTYFKEDVYGQILMDNGINVERILGSYLKRIFAIPIYILRGKFDVSVSLVPTPNFLNCLAASIYKGKRIVITGESSCDETQFGSIKGKVYAYYRKYADKIICNSQRAKEMWLRHIPRYARILDVIYNPVLLPEIKCDYLPKQGGRLHVTIASSVYKIKNPIGLIEALILMDEDERSKIQINWYGRKSTTQIDGDEYIKAVELIKENHLEDTLIFHEPTTEIAEKMKISDVVALFSQFEGLPNAICEGMMLGKPIIMSRMSDYEILVDSSNGILCDWDKPETIKDALLTMMKKSSEELIQMGVASKRKAQLLFEPQNVIEYWVKQIEYKPNENQG